jgi:hypothetical protein
MKELDPKEEEKVSKLAENIYRGLELTVEELQSTLPDEVDGLSAKQLRRALKAVINYPDLDDEGSKLTEREQRFLASMFALHTSKVQLEIKVIGELQREYDKKQQEEQGEE